MSQEISRRSFMRGLVGIVAGAAGFFAIAEEAEAARKGRNYAQRKQPVSRRPYQTASFVKDSVAVLLARVITGEATGCDDVEKTAIAYTAVNRANDGKAWNGTTVKGALLKDLQYTCISNLNKNRPLKARLMDPVRHYGKAAFEHNLKIARDVLSAKVSDPARAISYYNPDVVQDPNWKDLVSIGKIQTPSGPSKHIFYRWP